MGNGHIFHISQNFWSTSNIHTMGCGSSSVDESRLVALTAELQDSKLKANEQQNLLRFKVEVLVNMLAMEEKKSKIDSERVEKLKYLLAQGHQGLTEESITSLLVKAEMTDQDLRNSLSGSIERSASFRNVGLVDLAGALSRAQEDFNDFRTDIIPAFAEEDGKVVVSLSNDEFMKQLYSVTDKLTKADIQVRLTLSSSHSDHSFFCIAQIYHLLVHRSSHCASVTDRDLCRFPSS